jgi:hypothetical protein
MGANTAYGQSSSAIDLSAEAVGDDIDRALKLPRVLIEANLRAGSALLEFAGHCVHAETEFLEQLVARRNLDGARAAHTHLVTTMIDDYGRELTELMAAMKDAVAQLAHATATAPPARSA